jgi:ribonuclease VapC
LIVDTSAILAVLKREADATRYIDALGSAERALISAGTLLETTIVVDAIRDPVLSARLDEVVSEAGLVVVPVTKEQVQTARQAYRDYGKGNGHAAGLNVGDCFAYALARSNGEPLLYKGDDFTHTDLASVLAPETP